MPEAGLGVAFMKSRYFGSYLVERSWFFKAGKWREGFWFNVNVRQFRLPVSPASFVKQLLAVATKFHSQQEFTRQIGGACFECPWVLDAEVPVKVKTWGENGCGKPWRRYLAEDRYRSYPNG